MREGQDAKTTGASTVDRRAINDRREIFGWTMYDWANSAFSTTVAGALLSPYLTALAQNSVGENGPVLSIGSTTLVTAKSFWPFCTSLSVLLQVALLPVLGAIADYTNLKKRLMALFCYLGAGATCLLFFVQGEWYLLGGLLFVIANLSFGAAIVFYNAFLNDITTEDQRDRVSSQGFAAGYLGGGLLLAANFVLLTLGEAVGVDRGLAVRLSLLSAGLWWGGFALITFRRLRTREPAQALPAGESYIRVSFRQLAVTFRELKRLPNTLRYLLGYLFFNDGIQTVLAMASVFLVQELGVTEAFVLSLYLMMQFIAFGGALLFARIAAVLGSKNAILLALAIWSSVVIYAYGFLATSTQALAMGAAIALVLGGSQALSRSLFSQMIPAGREASFFGVYEISERGTSWIGPFIFGVVVATTNSYRQAILSLIVLFLAGMVILFFTDTEQAIHDAGNKLPGEARSEPVAA